MSIDWVTAFLDSPEETAAGSEVFWAALTGCTLSHRRGENAEFAMLLPDEGDAYLGVQEVARSIPGGMHLHLHTVDVPGLSARAEQLGATASYVAEGYVVCVSPGGLTFCVEPQRAGHPPPPHAWPSGRSVVDQVCLDIPPSRWGSEGAFWEALTGWPRQPAGEFERLVRSADVPLAFLLQELDDEPLDEQPTVTAHLDLACDDRDAETVRQESLGAEVVRREPRWTVMRDPAGRVYCTTDRRPGDV